MKPTVTQVAQAFCLALRDAESHRVPELTDEFVKLIIAERLGAKPEKILAAVGRAWDEVNHDRRVVITTARPHDNVARQLTRAFPDAEITTAIDPALKGGVVIRIGDQVLDASIKTKLEKLEHSLSR